LFNEGIVGQPYADPALLQQDLENAGRFFLNNVVNRNTNVKGFENVGFGGQNPNSGGIPEIGITSYDGYAAYDTISASSPVAEASAQGPAVGNTVNDFGTNNQEQDVEEGDVIVSDGERGKWLWADQGFTRSVDVNVDVAQLLIADVYFLSVCYFSLRCLRRLHLGLECEERRNTCQNSNATRRG
jgi:hypothetical protein